MATDKYIRFDWAAKRMLRDKANFGRNRRTDNSSAERLQYMQMTPKEKQAYDSHLDAVMTQNDVIESYRTEGRVEGLEEGEVIGLKKGRAEGRAELSKELAATMRSQGYTEEQICALFKISNEQ